MYALIVAVALVSLWLGFHFVKGFIQGFREGMRQTRWRHLKGVWRQCERANPRRDL